MESLHKKKIHSSASMFTSTPASFCAGFTLVEILLYVSIVSIILLVLSTFMFSILQARTKFKTISEVDQQGVQIMQIISRTIRNAEKINVPTQGEEGSLLSLDVKDQGKAPTIFNSAGTNIQIKEGTGSALTLINSRVAVSGLSFSNFSKTNTPGIIKFQFTLTYVNPSGRNEYDYSKTFYSSTALR